MILLIRLLCYICHYVYVLILEKNVLCFEMLSEWWDLFLEVWVFLNDVQSHLDQEASQVRSKGTRYIEAQCHRKGRNTFSM